MHKPEMLYAANSVDRFVIKGKLALVRISRRSNQTGFAIDQNAAAGNASEMNDGIELIKNARTWFVHLQSFHTIFSRRHSRRSQKWFRRTLSVSLG